MIKILTYVFFKIFYYSDRLLKIFVKKKSLLLGFNHYLQEVSYKSIKILNKEIKFFTPNQLTNDMVKSFYLKEPETLDWIDNFIYKKNLIFWDIGANIGLYSIYNSLKNENSTTFAFEPSTSNLRVLTRNISINNLENRIKVIPMPLTNKENIFQVMNESSFNEGGALNAFGETFDFEGKKIVPKMNYSIIGTTINYLIKNSILEIPDYIKIDVDGIEHLILEGGNEFLKDKKIKSLSIEINENFKNQFDQILSLMSQYDFKILHKKRNDKFYIGEFAKTYNYIFIR